MNETTNDSQDKISLAINDLILFDVFSTKDKIPRISRFS